MKNHRGLDGRGHRIKVWLAFCALLLVFAHSAFALPKLIGDLNEDGNADVLDVVRLMNFLNGRSSIAASQGIQLSDVSPYPPLPSIYADINEDGVIDRKDIELLEQAVLGISELPNPTAPPTLPAYPGSTNGPLLSLRGASQPGRVITISGDFTVIVTNTGANGDFNVHFPIASNRLNRIYVSSGSEKFGAGTPQVIEIVHDAEAPNLFIDFPTPSSEIITNSIIVAGRIGDMLSGYRGLRAWVTNLTALASSDSAIRALAGGEAIVDVGIGNNGTYARLGVPVILGANEIEVTAMDVLGNRRVKTTQIVRSDPTGKPQMIVLSGDGQATNVHLRLPQPIRVKILKADGSPFVRKLVTFEVTRSDGRLTSSSTDTDAGSLTYQVETDAQGIAQAWWTLGGDAGCGNNRVCASSRDIAGCGYFCASAFPAPASQINIGAGNNQKVETGGQPAETLRAWVNDSCNGVANVAVTFAVTQGGGKVRAAGSQDPWNSIVRIRTGITGHAAVEFQAGPDSGPNTVEANFLSNRFLPATFTIYGVARDAAKPTSFTGLVLDNTSRPIGAAQCLLSVNGKDYRSATDIQGRFRFENIESGRGHLYVNGQTATTLYTNQIRKGSFPALSYMHTIVPNAENSLSTPVLLPRLNTNNIRSYFGTNDVELTCEGMEGLKMRVKAGSLKRLADGSVPVNGQEIPISLNQVHHDQIPMPIPDGASPPFAWTLQPGGAVFDPPIEIEYPNMSGLPAGSIAYFLSFNHDTERFEIVASGHVSNDASTIRSDPGAGLTLAGWGCNCPPYSVTGACEPCQEEPTEPELSRGVGLADVLSSCEQCNPRLRIEGPRVLLSGKELEPVPIELISTRSPVKWSFLSGEGYAEFTERLDDRASLKPRKDAEDGEVIVKAEYTGPSPCSAYYKISVTKLDIDTYTVSDFVPDHKRRKIGVGELVVCTVRNEHVGVTDWVVKGNSTKILEVSADNRSVLFAAGERQSEPVVFASIVPEGVAESSTALLRFQVFEPDYIVMEPDSRGVGHNSDQDGALTYPAFCVYPTDVSFERVLFREQGCDPGTFQNCDEGSTWYSEGYYARVGEPRSGHRRGDQVPAYPPASGCAGTRMGRADEFGTSATSKKLKPPYEYGKWGWDIPVTFQACGSSVPELVFTVLHNYWEMGTDGRMRGYKYADESGVASPIADFAINTSAPTPPEPDEPKRNCPPIPRLSEVLARIPMPAPPANRGSLTEFQPTSWRPLAANVDDSWTFTLNGQPVQAERDGFFSISNVSAPDLFGSDGPGTRPDFIGDDYVRVIGHSSAGGTNRYAFSDFFQIQQGKTVFIKDLTFTDVPPRKPESLTAKPALTTLTQPGQTTQIQVVARFADGSSTNVSPQTSWTSYRLSNPSIVSIDKNGLVTAKGNGSVYITAVNEGTSSVTQVNVSTNDPLTTVVGYVQDTNGVAVAGATVTVSFLATTAITDANGRYTITHVPTGLGKLTITATYVSGTTQSTGASVSLDPVRGGTTDAGVVLMRAGFPGMVFIPPGTFVMGSPTSERGRGYFETQHTVILTKGFWMGQREVTQGEYLSVMGNNPSYFKYGVNAFLPGIGGRVTNDMRHPVEHVRWIDATNFCLKLTKRDRDAGLIPDDYAYRLPTEAEWEYACRGTTTNAFSFGAAIRQGMASFHAPWEYTSEVGLVENPDGIYAGRTVETGSYPPNEFGLYDMHGNVLEWCSDWFEHYVYTAMVDPIGNPTGFARSCRGGAWNSTGADCRAASRPSFQPLDSYNSIGFRVVLSQVRPSLPASFSGRLIRKSGDSIKGAEIVVGYRRYGYSVSNVTDSAGNFLVSGFLAGFSDSVLLSAFTYNNVQLVAMQTNLINVVEGSVNALGDIVLEPLTPRLREIPPGTFIMGSPFSEQERDGKETQHEVSLSSGFSIGQFEVTQSEFFSVLGINPSLFRSGAFGVGFTDDMLPVEQVSWIHATNYCAELTRRDRTAGLIPADYAYRLPTEAEWEYACRGGTTNAFSFGPAIRQGMANFFTPQEYASEVGSERNAGNTEAGRTVQIGTYAPNAFGLYDMHGNVLEWCSDRYGDYSTVVIVNPKGMASDQGPQSRVARGGSYNSWGTSCRSAARADYDESGSRYIGFRVVLARIPAPASFTGRFVDSRGQSIGGVNVVIGYRGETLSVSNLTESSGRFLLTGFAAGYTDPVVLRAYRYSGPHLIAIQKNLLPVREGSFTELVDLVIEPLRPEFVEIPAGTFVMGSPASEKQRGSDETQHLVTLTKGFRMGKYEVTQEEYFSVMGVNPSYFVNATSGKSGGVVTNDLRHPVEQVAWTEAQEYCNKLTFRDWALVQIPSNYGYRLPTEAEWEYACRGGSTHAFSFGSAIRAGFANFDTVHEYSAELGSQTKANLSLGRTLEVGTFSSNAFGLYDIHGNVSEWCSDIWAPYPAGSVVDPTGPTSGEFGLDFRVIRGGDWYDSGLSCRSAHRDLVSRPDSRQDPEIGFRVVLYKIR